MAQQWAFVRRRARAKIRLDAQLRGLPGTEHIHLIVTLVRGHIREPVNLKLIKQGPSQLSPLETGDLCHTITLEEPGQRRWIAVPVAPWIEPGVHHPILVELTWPKRRLRRAFHLGEHGGHWRLYSGRRWTPWLKIRASRTKARAETSNAQGR